MVERSSIIFAQVAVGNGVISVFDGLPNSYDRRCESIVLKQLDWPRAAYSSFTLRGYSQTLVVKNRFWIIVDGR